LEEDEADDLDLALDRYTRSERMVSVLRLNVRLDCCLASDLSFEDGLRPLSLYDAFIVGCSKNLDVYFVFFL
jgi:hypothetical protein